MHEFEGKSVLVTGAGGGIGGAIARSFASHGANVIGVDAQAPDPSAGYRWIRGDLREPAIVQSAVERAAGDDGRIDVLVNAAGVQLRKPAGALTEEEWQRLLGINLSSAYSLMRAAAPSLISARGSIVNIGSTSATRVLDGIVPYGATKAALTALGSGLAAELGPLGVRVNTVAPGHIRTPMTSNKLARLEVSLPLLERIPLGRFGEPEDIADVVLFLASDAARYITGAVLPIDGGYSLG